jgi:hypothetical protein
LNESNLATGSSGIVLDSTVPVLLRFYLGANFTVTIFAFHVPYFGVDKIKYAGSVCTRTKVLQHLLTLWKAL